MAPTTPQGGGSSLVHRGSGRLAGLPDGEEQQLTILQILTKSASVDLGRPDQPDVQAYRERNLQWRTGSAFGTHGEVSDLTPKGRSMDLDPEMMQRCASWPCLPERRKERQVWMLSEELELDLKAVYPKVWKTLQSCLLQVMILVLVIFTYAACPLTVSLAQVVGMDGKVPIKGRPFKEGSVIVASWALIALVGLALSAMAGGRDALRQCLDRRAIIAFAPAGVGWALADVCEVLAVARLDPATYGVISQARLLGAAAALWLIRGMGQSRLQWGILAALSMVCMAYCMVVDVSVPNKVRLLRWRLANAELKLNWHNEAPEEDSIDQGLDKDYVLGLVFALGKVALSVLSGVYGESCFKAMKDSKGRSPELQVQMTQISFSATLSALVGYVVICSVQGEDPAAFFSGPDGAWGWTTVLVAVVYCWREWICNICVKRFDSLVKNICNAVALVVTYGFTVSNGEKPFSPLKALLLLAVVLEVVNYSATRRAQPIPSAASEAEAPGGSTTPSGSRHDVALDFAGEYQIGSRPHRGQNNTTMELQGLSRSSSAARVSPHARASSRTT